ncbi:MAG: 1-acyl-sn-glycerol-3-phosphate acyltransferase, partial [Verrucomicrobia bacterium]|nr:1-acyl-sn-glycerol-3-phosphate acyltransferase [Verrucomicrobiota bacterium]
TKLEEAVKSPFIFPPYHKQILQPFNYYTFGLDFIKPLVDLSSSSVQGHAYLKEITNKLSLGENVIFLANHQIEADPQAISILLEDLYPKLAQEMIFVAGERVVLDPFAIPFSMGRNLLCIYSKRHIDHPPELKAQKQIHNKKTLELMSELLSEGGHSIYVAPSGGRDRADANGHVYPSKFDPQSIELFHLMTKKSSKPTSFYPMALATYSLLPPPNTIQTELGEERITNRGPIHLWIGPQISMDNFPGSMESDKRKRREIRAEYIWRQVQEAYTQFPS